MHKDVTGKDLNVGDKVVYSGSYRSQLHTGYVVGFTPKNIRVAPSPDTTYGQLKAPTQVAKVEE